MASLSEIMAPPPGPALGFQLADIGRQETAATTRSGITQSRILRDFSQYNLPDLINNEASRGTFHSGGAGMRADRMRTGSTEAIADDDFQLTGILGGLATQRVTATTGIQV